MAPMSNVPALVAPRHAAHRARMVAVATMTTTGTIGAGVRTRVQA